MDRFYRYAAYLANILLLFSVGFMLTQTYSFGDGILVMLIAVPAIISLLALYQGPDMEERKLARKVNKARLQQELKNLEKAE